MEVSLAYAGALGLLALLLESGGAWLTREPLFALPRATFVTSIGGAISVRVTPSLPKAP